MTTATPQDSPHRKVLMGALSPAVVDAIDGRIRELSAEQAARLIAPINAQLTELLEVQRANVAVVKAADVSPQVRQEVQATSDKAKEAAAATHKVIDQVKAGQPVSPVDVERAAEKVDEANEAVKETSRTIESRLTSVENDVAGLKAQVDQLETGSKKHEAVIASAFAQARASITGGYGLKQAAAAGLYTFVVSLVLYGLIVMITPIDGHWNWAIGLPAILAGIASAIVLLRSADYGVEVMSFAEAATIVEAQRQQREVSADQPPSIVFADEDEAAELTRVGRVSASARALVRTR